MNAIEQATWWTTQEALAYTRASRVQLWRWCKAGFIRASRLGHRTTVYEAASVKQFVESRLAQK